MGEQTVLKNGLQRLAQHSASNETPFEFIKTQRYAYEIRLTEVEVMITCLLPVRKKKLFRGNLNRPECRARHLTNTPRVKGLGVSFSWYILTTSSELRLDFKCCRIGVKFFFLHRLERTRIQNVFTASVII